MSNTLQHIGVMGMHWGRRKGSTESGSQKMARLRRDAKPWGVTKVVGLGTAMGLSLAFAPMLFSVPLSVAIMAGAAKKGIAMNRANAALKKIKSQKVKALKSARKRVVVPDAYK